MGDTSQTKYRKQIIKRLQSLGLYKSEFTPTIERLASLYVELDKLNTQYEQSGGNPVIMHTNTTGGRNPKKNPILQTRDEVYTQLLAHERELGLTPAALKKINDGVMKTTQVSGFASALADALRGAGE